MAEIAETFRVERPAVDRILENYSLAASWVIFLFTRIGHSPFHEADDAIATAAGGSSVRQIIWLTLLLLVLPICWHHRNRLLALGRELYLFLIALGICWASVLWAISPAISLRRVILITIILLVFMAITVVHRSVDSWMAMLVVTSGITMLVNWYGVIFLPHLAITELGWSGLYDHKNGAGGVVALFILIWLFAAINTRRPWLAGVYCLGVVLWVVFLIGTKSKTSISLLVVTGSIGLMVELVARGGRGAFTILACLIPGALAALAAGLVWLTPRKFLILTFDDPTMTGRTIIWQFMVRQIRERPIEGHGYGSFWMIGDRSPVIREGTGWMVGTTQGHNGYLDLAATIGIVGTTVFVCSLLFALWTVGRIALSPRARETGRYVGLFVALIMFALLHNMLESTFMRGGQMVWVAAYMSMILVALIWAGHLRTSAAPKKAPPPAPLPVLGR